MPGGEGREGFLSSMYYTVYVSTLNWSWSDQQLQSLYRATNSISTKVYKFCVLLTLGLILHLRTPNLFCQDGRLRAGSIVSDENYGGLAEIVVRKYDECNPLWC